MCVTLASDGGLAGRHLRAPFASSLCVRQQRTLIFNGRLVSLPGSAVKKIILDFSIETQIGSLLYLSTDTRRGPL